MCRSSHYTWCLAEQIIWHIPKVVEDEHLICTVYIGHTSSKSPEICSWRQRVAVLENDGHTQPDFSPRRRGRQSAADALVGWFWQPHHRPNLPRGDRILQPVPLSLYFYCLPQATSLCLQVFLWYSLFKGMALAQKQWRKYRMVGGLGVWLSGCVGGWVDGNWEEYGCMDDVFRLGGWVGELVGGLMNWWL